MKIILLHPAQITTGKRTDQHPPGARLSVDDAQAARLITAGYAIADATEPDPRVKPDNASPPPPPPAPPASSTTATTPEPPDFPEA